MKFWTVQKKEVIEIIIKEGIYMPDFSKSDYLQRLPDLKFLYDFILKSYNRINSMNLHGLIYAFAKSEDEIVCQIQNNQEFFEFILSKKYVINGLWKQLSKNDVVVVELDYDVDFNPIYLDINDFQFLMPPIIASYPFSNQDIDRVCWSIENGRFTRSVLPSDVIQAHLPYIKSDNIVNIYSMFDIE